MVIQSESSKVRPLLLGAGLLWDAAAVDLPWFVFLIFDEGSKILLSLSSDVFITLLEKKSQSIVIITLSYIQSVYIHLVYLFSQLSHLKQNATQGQFLSRVQQV